MSVMDRIEGSAENADSFQNFNSSGGRAEGVEAGSLFLFREANMKTSLTV